MVRGTMKSTESLSTAAARAKEQPGKRKPVILSGWKYKLECHHKEQQNDHNILFTIRGSGEKK